MKAKILELALPVIFLVLTSASLSGAAKEEIVRKNVSVKSPKRVNTVISHFTPADHVYEAEGNVLIEREKKIVEPPKIPQNYAKKVLVHSPLFGFSESKHFDPAVPKYEAVGELLIDEKSPLLNDHQNILLSTYTANAFNGAHSGLGVAKSVSVQSPVSQTSVIDHFNPVGHKYAAQGNVLINRAAPSFTSDFNKVYSASVNSHKINTAKIFNTQKISGIRNVNRHKVVPQTQNRLLSGFSLHKSVSVKSPERHSSVINHFTPAGHIYTAKGDVVINRSSVLENKAPILSVAQNILSKTQFNSKPRGITAKPFIHTFQTKKVAPNVKVESIKGNAKHESHFNSGNAIFVKTNLIPTQNKFSEISLQRSVSVASPQRQSNVINHFNPAGHNYAATGNVVVNRQSSRNEPRLKVTKPKPVINTVQSQPKINIKIIKETNIPENNLFVSTSSTPLTKTKFSGIKTIRKDNDVRFTSQSTFIPVSNIGTSGISLHKSVSVKSPQRQSSVISHFTPNTHNYAATGNVVINRASSFGELGSILTQPKPVKKTILLVQKQPKPVSVISNAFSSQSIKLSSPKIAKVTTKLPAKISTKFSSQNQQNIGNNNKNYNRVPSLVTQQTFKETQFVAPTVKFSIIKNKPTVKVTTFVDKNIKNSISQASTFSTNLGSSRISLQKSVSVKSPQSSSSVIKHFSPAIHNYAATGNVVINRESSFGGSGAIFSQSTPSKKVVSIIQKQPAPVASIKNTAHLQTTLFKSPALKKTVAIKSSQLSNEKENKFAIINKVKVNRIPVQPTLQIIKKSPSVATTINAQLSNNRLSNLGTNNQISASITQGNIQSSNAGSPGLFLKKSVTVHSPQHKSSVISHFTPAVHSYAATGNVVISRGSKTGATGATFSQGTQIKNVIKINSNSGSNFNIKTDSQSIKTIQQGTGISSFKINSNKNAQVSSFKPSIVSASNNVGASISNFKPPQTDLNVQKFVSVKSPARKSSVINHFSPAQHIYAAKGNVVINKGTSSFGVTSSIGKPSTINIGLTNKLSLPKVEVIKVFTAPISEIQSPEVDSEEPESNYFAPEVAEDDDDSEEDSNTNFPFKFGAGPSQEFQDPFAGIGLYMTPHTSENYQAPSFQHNRAIPAQSPISFSLPNLDPAPTSGNLNLQKVVSVQSPPDQSTVIDHFNPQKHVYKATGKVNINRSL